jgi:hypothetical protein
MSPYGQTAGVTETDVGEDSYVTGVSPTTTSVEPTAAASNITISQLFGFFNIMVGLMLVASFLLFFGGLTGYLTRLGLEGRVEGWLRYMYRGVAILFVLIVLLGIVKYLQFHPSVVFTILAVIVVIFMAWAALQVSFSGGGDEEEH